MENQNRGMRSERADGGNNVAALARASEYRAVFVASLCSRIKLLGILGARRAMRENKGGKPSVQL